MALDRKQYARTIGNFFVLVGKPFFYSILFALLITHSLVLVAFKLTRRFLSSANQSLSQLKKYHFPPIHLSIQKTSPIKPYLKSILKICYSFFSSFNHHLFLIIHFIVNKFSSILGYQIKLPQFFHQNIPLPRIKPVLFVLLTISSISIISFYQLIIKDLPHPKDLINRHQAVTTKIYDRNHQLLYKVYQNENRSIVTLADIPDYVIKATLAIEDSEFYDHPGFSIKGIIRAFKRNVTDQRLQGGSTITQQLVKNTLLTPEKTLTRKVKELILALAVESYFTKEEILTMYFNQVGFGGTAYGIEEAAQYYFGKSIKDANLAEAAVLAGLPAAPTTFSPFGTHPELAVVRQKEVLRRMVEENFISETNARKAIEYPLHFSSPTIDILAPHFVMYVKDLLAQQYSEIEISQGGLEVVTTLDLNIQSMAQEVLTSELDHLKQLNVTNAAVIITRPQTGEILAMVGSHDYFDTQNDGQVNVTLRPRQPGSSIKPVNYAVALESGYTPATIIQDAPITYHTPGSPPYSPKNYDGQFHGHVTLRQALANSYNVPAVKTLHQFGVNKMVEMGQKLGITTWDNPSRFGLSLTLGGGEVTLKDMAVVYGTFANFGRRVDLQPIMYITDYQHISHYQSDCYQPNKPANKLAVNASTGSTSDCSGVEILSPSVAFLISDILSDNQARSAAFGANSVLNIPHQQVAVKTGTTNSLRDNWTIGYTQDYVVVVWVGNNNNSPMSYIASGITGASPIWSRIMTNLLKDREIAHQFTPPNDITQASICSLTNTLTCDACPVTKKEYFIAGTEPLKHCTNQQIQHILDPQANPPNIAQFSN